MINHLKRFGILILLVCALLGICGGTVRALEQDAPPSLILPDIDSAEVEAYEEGKTGGLLPSGLSIGRAETGSTGFAPAYATTPSAYDMRDASRVTSVKDQHPYGTCWSFAAINSAESSVITNGYGVRGNTDLSEYHLAYFSYNRPTDPLGGTNGDKVIVSRHFLDIGGNQLLSTTTLANWMGTARESVAPYASSGASRKALSSSWAYTKNSFKLENAYWISLQDQNTVKQLIMSLGAAATAYYDHSDYLSAQNAYYCPLDIVPNHGVSIVGWDDHYPASNFGGRYGSNQLPPQNGAWLIKNSWGNAYGEAGYFWLSYHDASLNSDYSNIAYFYDMSNPAESYDYNYQYDGSATLAWSNTNQMANIYTAQGAQDLKAVGFYTYDTNVSYRVRIYTGNTAANPTSGTLACDTGGKLAYSGFHTIRLPKTVYLPEGKRFSVVITLTAGSNYDKPHLLVDASHDYGWVHMQSSAEAGQSFLGKNDNGWQDVSKQGINCRIKAFTDVSSDLRTAAITKIADQIYTGKGIKPVPSVTLNGKKLKNGTDFTLAYSNNTSLGTGSVTISGIGSYKGKRTVKFTIVPIQAPSGTKATSAAYNAVKLSWVKASGATGYQVYAAASANGTYSRVASIIGGSTTSYTHKGLTTGKTYYYKVRAYRKIGAKTHYSSYGPVLSARPVPKKAQLTLNASYNSIKLSWAKISGASGYQISRATSANGAFSSLTTRTGGSTTSYTHKGLTTGKTYYYKVRAFRNVNGSRVYGPFSAVQSAKAAPKKPAVKVTGLTYDTVKLGWKAIAGANGYEVLRSTSASGGFKLIKNLTKSTSVLYTDKSLHTGTAYYYRVRAYRTVNGKKIYGAYHTVSAQPALAKTKAKAAAVSYASVKLSWEKVAGASGYAVNRAEGDGSYVRVGTLSGANTLSFTDKTIKTGVQYRYKVRAYRVVGGKNVYAYFSPVVSAKPALAKTKAKAAAVSHASVKLSWEKVAGASGYAVNRAAGSGSYVRVGTLSGVNTLSFTDKTVKTGVQYHYKVRAYRVVDGKNVYAYFSPVVSAKPPAKGG
ncbi:MAG: lectin like domain-containing protein [Christensenellales bacterium]